MANVYDPTPTPTELNRAASWAHEQFGEKPRLPFGFLLGERCSHELLHTWRFERSDRNLDAARDEIVLQWKSPDRLTLRCVVTRYRDYPVCEWTAYLRNDGGADTPIIRDLTGIDAVFGIAADAPCVLHHHIGSPCRADDYAPHEKPLVNGANIRIATDGGRSSNSDLPYFAIDMNGSFLLLAIGWPGQWEAVFRRGYDGVVVRAKQEDTHFRLHPGEEVRTPRMALMLADGPRYRAQNMWRRWMLAHIVPRPTGGIPDPQLTPCSSHQYGEMIHADEASQCMFIDRYLEERLGPDYWWMDAGWYPNETGWPNTGTWKVDPKRFPRGLRAVSDHAHERGLRTVVWFEPERVTPGTELWNEHADWLLPHPEGAEHQRLLDLGNDDAREWLTERVAQLITEQRIDLYRQDFNMDPLPYWRKRDADDRRGITENHHVTGLLTYWDELRRRFPTMLIDECASGGRRNDIEMMSRAVPLLRSDYILEARAQQCHTYGIAHWIPWYGTGANAEDDYGLLSQLTINVIGCWDLRRNDLDYEVLREKLTAWREWAPLMLGDFYPLTRYDLGEDVWMAWQFDRPDLKRGMVQAFRRPESPFETARFSLHALESSARYRISGVDAEPVEANGTELMNEGLPVTLTDRPAARIIFYEQVR